MQAHLGGLHADIRIPDCSLSFVLSKRTAYNTPVIPAIKAPLGQNRTFGPRLPLRTEPHLSRHVCGSATTSAAPLLLSPQYTIRYG